MQHSHHIVLLQCEVLRDHPSEQDIGNNSIVIVSAISSQPCSSIQQWVNSPGHVIVVDDHAGCSGAADESDQLILRLMKNGSCSRNAEQQSIVKLQGHPAESFEAFSKLSLRLYRGPNAVPQAKAGRGPSSAANDTASANSSATVAAGTTGLYVPEAPSVAKDVEHDDTESMLGGWLWRVTDLLKSLSNCSGKKARMLTGGGHEMMREVAQLSNASQESYPHSTHGRHLLAGRSCLFRLVTSVPRTCPHFEYVTTLG